MAKGHGSGSRLRRSGLAGLVTVALVAFLAACSAGSDTATTRTGNEDTTAFCNTYDELSRTSLNHNTGDPATNEESWKKHLALAK